MLVIDPYGKTVNRMKGFQLKMPEKDNQNWPLWDFLSITIVADCFLESFGPSILSPHNGMCTVAHRIQLSLKAFSIVLYIGRAFLVLCRAVSPAPMR